MAKCLFCEKKIEKGTGTLYVFKSGKVANLCSTKCEKNMLKLGRKARNLKWTTEKKEKKE